METYRKPIVWSVCIVSGMVVGYFIDGKYFGTTEGAFAGLIVGAFATAYLDAKTLPANGATA